MRTPALRARSAGHEQLDQQNVGRAMANGLRARGFGEGAISGGLASIKIWCMICDASRPEQSPARAARFAGEDASMRKPACQSGQGRYHVFMFAGNLRRSAKHAGLKAQINHASCWVAGEPSPRAGTHSIEFSLGKDMHLLRRGPRVQKLHIYSRRPTGACRREILRAPGACGVDSEKAGGIKTSPRHRRAHFGITVLRLKRSL